jgi:hypothetical protein
MKRKFSILLSIKKDGTPSSKIYDKENVREAINAFVKARAEGIESYLFMSPRPDKRCKSEETKQELINATGGESLPVQEVQEVKATKALKKASKIAEGITDLE